MKVAIRRAKHQDTDALTALLEELFAIEADFDFDARRQQRGLTRMLDGCGKHRNVLVAEAGGRVVAMATAQLVVSTAEGALSAWIEDVVVAPPWQGQGIGPCLLDAITDWAAAAGATRFQLLAGPGQCPGPVLLPQARLAGNRLICSAEKATDPMNGSSSQRIRIIDTTLRDGAQTPGIAFSREQKIAMARLLDEIGVDELEAGTPVMGKKPNRKTSLP